MILSVYLHIGFLARFFGQGREEREWRIHELLENTGLAYKRLGAFVAWPESVPARLL
jgi:hypothetical protein